MIFPIGARLVQHFSFIRATAACEILKFLLRNLYLYFAQIHFQAMDRIYFSGTFDGQGHTISGIYIAFMGDAVESYNYQGLFGYIDGVVRNLNVTESYIYFELFSYIGGIAGRSDGTIQDCSYSGKVTGQSTVGGIAGYSSGTVKNCINRGTVTSSGSGASGSCGASFSRYSG